MTPKHLFILLLAIFATSVAQTVEELHIPVENDNQFPPDQHSELDEVLEEGSGAGEIDAPLEISTKSTETSVPLLEDVQPTSTLVNSETSTSVGEHTCPTACVCNIEGDSKNYVVDCSGSDLTELPTPLDSKTTELNLQNNKLTVITKDISDLKDLKVLNVNNNQIKDIVAGSISELPELTSLKLGNNRLVDYPTDLKNSFGLTKLEELDLGGNDMRTVLKSETFSNFIGLRKLILPSAAAGIVEDVCASLKASLETVCTETCNNTSFDCPDAPHIMDDDLLDFALPGLIALGTSPEEIGDPSLSTVPEVEVENETQESVKTPPAVNVEPEINTSKSVPEVSFHSVVINATDEETKPSETDQTPIDEEPASKLTIKTEVVEATTSNTKTGGVDRSVIIIIVGGMVLIVAGITIKKNWSSIRNRFSSSPRPANDRTGISSNGTAPEEVPLQEKSPV